MGVKSRIKSKIKSGILAAERYAAPKVKAHLAAARKKLSAAEKKVIDHVKKNPKRAVIIAAAIGAGVALATIKALRQIKRRI